MLKSLKAANLVHSSRQTVVDDIIGCTIKSLPAKETDISI